MIATRKPALAHPVTQAFVASAVALGKAEHIDINNIASVGDAAGQQDINVDMNMRRISAAHAYLLPALSRKNLTLLPGTTVTKLDISGGNCRGVVAMVDGQERRFAAAREVVVCAGGLKSPKLLMLSGIGPAEHLRQHGIPVIVDAPRIGANLHDHLLVRLVFSTKEQGRAADRHRPLRHHLHAEQFVAEGSGHPGVRPPERAEREGSVARHGLPHHARPDEAEEPRHGTARLGRSERAAAGRSAIFRRAGRRRCLRGRHRVRDGDRQRQGLRRRAQGAGQHPRTPARRRSSSTSAPTPRPISTSSAPARWAARPRRRSTRRCGCAA